MVYPGTSQIHAVTFAKAMGWGVGETPTHNWIFVIGISPESTQKVSQWRSQGIKVAYYWIGSDSLCAMKSSDYRRQIPEADLHLCVHERIKEELERWQVSARVVYPCARNTSEGEEIPAARMVGVYMPEVGDLYMYPEVLQISMENPSLPFLFYGLNEYPNLPKNVVVAGRLAPEETAAQKMSVMLRLTRHDGFPIGGIEAKMKGLHVIENYPYKGFLYAKSLEDVNNYLQQDATHRGDDGAWPAWYREQCSPKKFGENVFREMEILL